jgi:hypothetical protein
MTLASGYPAASNAAIRNWFLTLVQLRIAIAASEKSFLLASINEDNGETLNLNICEQSRKAYAIFECKRVGVEEGMSKGPQTIEKAKQGAYVARTASSLQKIRTEKESCMELFTGVTGVTSLNHW